MNTLLSTRCCALAITFLLSIGCASAQNWERGGPGRGDRGPGMRVEGRPGARPPFGARVPALPRGARPYRFGGSPYYLHGGTWYRRGGPGFIVTRPPVGAFIDVLPPFYTTVWFAGAPFYYADDVYYQWDSTRRVYIVSDPPESAAARSDETRSADELFIYPKNGQNEEQQSTDRYDCHRWAADQTGFDPTRAGGNVADEQRSDKRTDYQRAQTACLEARGYSVK